MYLLIILWILTLYFGFKVWQNPKIQPKNILKKNFLNFKKSPKDNTLFLKKIGNLKYLSSPGFWIKKTTDKSKIKHKLALTGNKINYRTFIGIKQVILSFFFIYFWLYIWFGDVTWENSGTIFFLMILSFYLPDLWLQAKKERYMNTLDDEVPYFMDLLSLTLQTGMNIDQALKHTAEHKKGIVAKTIQKKLAELKFGRNIDDILHDIKKILPNEEFHQFINSIARAKKLGVSLSQTLEIQSKLMRTKRRQKAEEISRTAAVKISLPLVLFIFPALLIIYIGPGMLHLMSL